MNKVWSGAVAFAALAVVGVTGTAQAAQCIWLGTYWDCGDRYIYPRSYPWDTRYVNGRYSMPPSPDAADLGDLPPTAPPPHY